MPNAPYSPQKTYTAQEVQTFLRLLQQSGGLSEKAAGTTPSSYFVHGPTGIYAQPGQRADVMNAMILPVGIQGFLESSGNVAVSRMANEVFPIQTGQTAGSGSEPTNACDDAPQPGNLKVCNVTFPFGRLVRDSQVLQADRPGLIVNRSEFLDQTLIGNPFTNYQRPIEIDPAEALRTEVGKKLVELYNDWILSFSHLAYDGNPANTTGNTGYIEYYGLDKLINTGYQDAYTGQACSAADSVIVNFGTSPVTGNENQIVKDIVETYAYLEYLAGRVKLNPVEWVISMRQSLYRKLSEIWPCVYYTYRCVISQSNNTGFVDASMQVKMRDDMRNGVYDGNPGAMPYLLIDGKRVNVLIDDSINESVPSAGTFVSDIYFIPVSVRGGRPTTYMQYFDLNAPGGMRDVAEAFAPNMFEITGNGRFWLHRKPPSNECVQIRLGGKPRLILETPFLAARVTNVAYSPVLLHERSPYPNSPYYFVDGGLTTGGAPYFYAPTS